MNSTSQLSLPFTNKRGLLLVNESTLPDTHINNRYNLVEYLSPLIAILLAILIALVILYFCVICPWTTDYTNRGAIMSSWRGRKHFSQSHESTMKQRYIGRRISGTCAKPTTNRFYQRSSLKLPKILVNSISAPNITTLNYADRLGCRRQNWRPQKSNNRQDLWTKTLRSLSSEMNWSVGSLASLRPPSSTSSAVENTKAGALKELEEEDELKIALPVTHTQSLPTYTIALPVTHTQSLPTYTIASHTTATDTKTNDITKSSGLGHAVDKIDTAADIVTKTECELARHNFLCKTDSQCTVDKPQDDKTPGTVWLKKNQQTSASDSATLCEIVGPNLVQHLSVV